MTDVAGIVNITDVAEIVKLTHVARILEAGSMYDLQDCHDNSPPAIQLYQLLIFFLPRASSDHLIHTLLRDVVRND